MPSVCAVPYCQGNRKSGPKVHVFGFPKDRALRNKWIEAINIDDFTPTKYSKVCVKHFRNEEIRRETSYFDEKTLQTLTCKLGVPRLEKNTVPTQSLICEEPLYSSHTQRCRNSKSRKIKVNFKLSVNKGSKNKASTNLHNETPVKSKKFSPAKDIFEVYVKTEVKSEPHDHDMYSDVIEEDEGEYAKLLTEAFKEDACTEVKPEASEKDTRATVNTEAVEIDNSARERVSPDCSTNGVSRIRKDSPSICVPIKIEDDDEVNIDSKLTANKDASESSVISTPLSTNTKLEGSTCKKRKRLDEVENAETSDKDTGGRRQMTTDESSRIRGRYICTLCPYEARLKHMLQKHTANVHPKRKSRIGAVRPEVKAISCELCSYNTNSRQRLAQHCKVSHGAKNPYSCKVCRFVTKFACVLKRHMQSAHAKKRQYSCKLW